jgi:Flp pilus assembly protein TadG
MCCEVKMITRLQDFMRHLKVRQARIEPAEPVPAPAVSARHALLTSSLRRRFGRNDKGVAAVEFAFIAPIMLYLLIGIVDVSNAVSLNWRMVQLNRTLADITTQSASVTANELTRVFAAATAILAPYKGTLPTMSIYSVTIDKNGKATVCWASHSTGTEAKVWKDGSSVIPGWTMGATVTLPRPEMKVPNSSLIVTAAEMPFEGILSTYANMMTPGYKMSSKPLYFRPRQGSKLGPDAIEQVGQIQNDANKTNFGC